jgi:hypothetical protein
MMTMRLKAGIDLTQRVRRFPGVFLYYFMYLQEVGICDLLESWTWLGVRNALYLDHLAFERLVDCI